MGRVIRFLGFLPLLVLSGASTPRTEIPEANQIPNWSAPPYWTPSHVRAPGESRTDSAITASAPLPFIVLTPCRVADTRGNGFTGQYGPPSLLANTTRDFTISGQCGIPGGAAGVSFNFAALNVGAAGDLRVFPTGGTVPLVSTLNYNANTPNIANAAVVPLGTSGAITVQADAVGIDLIIDVNGYYDGSGTLQLSLSRRAALDQFWTPQNGTVLGLTAVGTFATAVRSDGSDLWVANAVGNSVSRVRGSDAKLLETWLGATSASGVLVTMGRVFVAGQSAPGALYQIEPSQTPGAVTTVASNLGNFPNGITFDGARIWTANVGGSVSIVTPGLSVPWTVTNVATGFAHLVGALYDGANVWVTDYGTGTLMKLDSAGAILQTVTVGSVPFFPIFDGTKIWVPNEGSNSVSVVRASSGAVLATLTGNGLSAPYSAAFDGERVLVTNSTGNSVSLWRAADLTPLGSFGTGAGTNPNGTCSDGVNFWIALSGTDKLARF